MLNIFCDGSVKNNMGGWGFILQQDQLCLAKKGSLTTEKSINRVELLAVLYALSVVPDKTEVNVYSDSSYVMSGAKKRGDKHRGPLWDQYFAHADRLKLTLIRVVGFHPLHNQAHHLAREATNAFK